VHESESNTAVLHAHSTNPVAICVAECSITVGAGTTDLSLSRVGVRFLRVSIEFGSKSRGAVLKSAASPCLFSPGAAIRDHR
jgi:hypothetical protein